MPITVPSAVGQVLDGEDGRFPRVQPQHRLEGEIDGLGGDGPEHRVTGGGPVHHLRVVAPAQVMLGILRPQRAKPGQFTFDHSGNAYKAWEQMRTDPCPKEQTDRHHQLRFDLAYRNPSV
ncbi:hypothetical protein ACFY93_22220 [Streptomyces sp. NPDC008313]|uniref:hypothetical protein n=1 Tax=Streptomyces sp. NPDC008313 TaxID=3364826 RepID=UPI0036E8FACF